MVVVLKLLIFGVVCCGAIDNEFTCPQVSFLQWAESQSCVPVPLSEVPRAPREKNIAFRLTEIHKLVYLTQTILFLLPQTTPFFWLLGFHSYFVLMPFFLMLFALLRWFYFTIWASEQRHVPRVSSWISLSILSWVMPSSLIALHN